MFYSLTLSGNNKQILNIKKIKIIDACNDFEKYITISKVFPLNHENFYIIGSKKANIHQINKDYQITNSFGGKGDGPGEFRRINGADYFKNKFYIYDASKRQVSIFTDKGFFLKSIVTPREAYLNFYVLNENKFLCEVKFRDHHKVVIMDSSLTIQKILINRKLIGKKTKQGMSFEFKQILIALDRKQQMIYLCPSNIDKYKILAFDFNGNFINKITKKYHRIHYTKEEKKKTNFSSNKYKFAIRNMFFDKKGRLLVESASNNYLVNDSKYREFDIYKGGNFLGKAKTSLPQKGIIKFFNDYIYILDYASNTLTIYNYD